VSIVISCVDRSRLQQLLALSPDSEERRALDTHLGQCDACRRLLLEFTSEAMRITASAGPASEHVTADFSGSRTQDRKLGGDSAPTQTRVKEADFLEPPHRPEHLGRLAHYELIEVIGRGGMGTVFKAHDDTLHRIVAVKLMSPELAASETSRQRFIREARAAAQIAHEHVVTIHAVDDKGRVPFLVMQHVEGRSLQQRLQEGPLAVEEIVRIGEEMAEGLAAAHAKGLVHRDIKPGNVLLESPGGKVKITDFGLARAVDDASISQSGAVIGTPLYMAPEQARGAALDHRADLFSLGAVLYALCTGQSPFRAATSLGAMKRVCDDDPEPIRPVNPNVPAWLEQIIRKLLKKKPDDRFQSAPEVAQLLANRLDGVRAGPADTQHRTEETPAARKRKRLPYYVGTAAVLLIASIGTIVWLANRDRKDDNRQIVQNKEHPKANIPDPNDAGSVPVLPGFEQLWQGGGLLPSPEQFQKLLEMHPFVRNPEAFQNLFQGLGVGGGGVRENAAPVGWMANSSDGKLIAVPVGGSVVILVDKDDEIPEIEEASAPVHCVAFSPDRRFLVGGCESKSANVVIWSLASGKMQQRLAGHRGEINSIAFGKDAQFVTSSNDGTAKIWKIGAKDPSVTFSDHLDFVRCAVFSPTQTRVASGGDDKIGRVWNAADGKAIKELKGHTASIRSIAFHPNGKLLVTGSDSELKVWDAESYDEYTTIQTPAGWLAFAPDGLTLFSAGCDHKNGTEHVVTLWNTRTWEKRTSYTLKSRGSEAVYHLSSDGGILLGNRSRLQPGTPVAIYHALTGKDLSSR
jgi:eukaryotic-like serine/threonine-protein kinase